MNNQKSTGKTRSISSILAFTLLSGMMPVSIAQIFADTAINKPFNITTDVEDVKPDFVDIDNDGDFDLFYGSHENIYYQENIGSDEAPDYDEVQQNPFGITQVGDYSRPVFVDIDNDADTDLFIGQIDGDIFYQENIGTADLPEFESAIANPFGIDNTDCDVNKPVFVDIDDDGDSDLFFGPGFEGDLMYQENEGSASAPSFGKRQTNPFGLVYAGRYPSPAFGDLDNDGDKDLLIGTYGVEIYYFKNIGSLTAPAFGDPVPNPYGMETLVDGLGAPVFVDIDDDTDLDVFIGTFEGSVLFHENIMVHTSDVEIDNPQSDIAIEVFPIPANNVLHIETDLDLRKIEILDVTGTTIWADNFANSINIGQIKDGLYLLRLTDSNVNRFVKRIIIN